MLFKSVKFQLTLWYACILAIILSVFSFFMYLEFSRTLYRDTDEILRREVAAFEKILGDSLEKQWKDKELTSFSVLTLNSADYPAVIRENLELMIQSTGDLERFVNRSSLMLKVVGFDKKIFTSNLRGWESEIIFPDYERDSVFMEKGDSYQTIHFRKNPIRLYYHLVRYKTRPLFIVQCGKSIAELESSLQRLIFIILISIPGAVMAACLAGWFLAKRSFSPIDSMINEARQITAAYLKGRLPRRQTGDELDRLAETLNEMMDRIEASTRAIQEFSSDISHELKTPLAIIRGEIELALRRERSPDSLKETLRTIEEEVEELIKLVNDLLLLVRSDAKQFRIEKVRLSIGPILKQVIERFQERAGRKQISLRLIMDTEYEIAGDALYLKRLVSNLVDNAIKFTPEKGNVVVEMKSQDAQHVLIRIVDDGPGIELELQEKVFSRFFRTDLARSQEGAGLGLNIAKALAEAHQGSLRIESQPGRGTTVLIRLPKLF